PWPSLRTPERSSRTLDLADSAIRVGGRPQMWWKRLAWLGSATWMGFVMCGSARAQTWNYELIQSLEGGTEAASLIQVADGSFRGTTPDGGPGGSGLVFRMSAAGELTTIAPIDCGPVAASGPLLEAADGSLYGVTSSGGVYGMG